MIHGIYVKSRPKGYWHLVSITLSAFAAETDISDISKKAKDEGKENIEVGFQVFESDFHIPEYLTELKTHTLLYN
jgi:hypothetical protein